MGGKVKGVGVRRGWESGWVNGCMGEWDGCVEACVTVSSNFCTASAQGTGAISESDFATTLFTSLKRPSSLRSLSQSSIILLCVF